MLGNKTWYDVQLQMAFCCLVYPCLVRQYMGQAAFLSKNPFELLASLYCSIPGEFATVSKFGVLVDFQIAWGIVAWNSEWMGNAYG